MHALFGSFMSLGPRGMFFSSSFHITAPLHFHLISLVVFFISSSLSYLLLVCFIFLFTLSGYPPQFITWRIVMSFSTIYLADTCLEILGLRRSSRQREFVCYLSTWECVHLLLISSLGFICSCSGYVYLYI